MAVPFSERVMLAGHVLAQEIQGEVVLLNLTSQRYFALDEMGSSVWQELTAASSIEVAYERLLSLYEVGPGQLREDLQAFVQQLVTNDLVEVSR